MRIDHKIPLIVSCVVWLCLIDAGDTLAESTHARLLPSSQLFPFTARRHAGWCYWLSRIHMGTTDFLSQLLSSSLSSSSLIRTLHTSTICGHRLQHCLEWVMRVYTSKLTPDSVVTYLFHDCEQSLWLFCLVWHVHAMTKVQYTSTDS